MAAVAEQGRDAGLLTRIDAAIIDSGQRARADDAAAQRILEAVSTTLGEGQVGLAFKTVAARSGVPVTVVRKLFPTRHALIRGYLQSVRMMNLQACRFALAADPSPDGMVRVVRMIASSFENQAGIGARRRTIELWAESLRSSVVRADFLEIQGFWSELVEFLVRQEIGEGRDPFTPRNVTALLLACFNGAVVSSTLAAEAAEGVESASTAVALWMLVKAHCIHEEVDVASLDGAISDDL